MDKKTFDLIELLISRLERISADSPSAHRASGIRGALLSFMDEAENNESARQISAGTIIDMGFAILESAAREKSEG